MGYAQMDSRVIIPQGVASNHFAIATTASCMGAILPVSGVPAHPSPSKAGISDAERIVDNPQ